MSRGTPPRPVIWENTVGNTPLLRLARISQDTALEVYAKLEMFNPGGSMKDRSALSMVRAALDDGTLKPGGTVVESSSGNMGIGLARACLHYNIRFICVVDKRTNQTNIGIMRALHAEVEVISSPLPNKSLLESRLHRISQILDEVPGSIWINQYANENNAHAHETTCYEILKALDDNVDYIYCATGTCGTIRGISDYIHTHALSTRVVAVDAVGSVIFGGESQTRLIPGHGSAVQPPLFRETMADRVIYATDADCVRGCRDLVASETILGGGSSGAVLSAFLREAPLLPVGSVVVLLLPDRGENYLDTIYNNAWVHQHHLD